MLPVLRVGGISMTETIFNWRGAGAVTRDLAMAGGFVSATLRFWRCGAMTQYAPAIMIATNEAAIAHRAMFGRLALGVRAASAAASCTRLRRGSDERYAASKHFRVSPD